MGKHRIQKVFDILITIFLIKVTVDIVTRPYPGLWIIDNINLIFHEAGHTITYLLGEFISVASGSIFEIGIPLSIAIYFILKKKTYGAVFCLWWLHTALRSVAIYSSDARTKQLPLLGGEAVHHDWAYILGKLNLLKYDQVIGTTFEYLALLVVLYAIFLMVRKIMKSLPHLSH